MDTIPELDFRSYVDSDIMWEIKHHFLTIFAGLSFQKIAIKIMLNCQWNNENAIVYWLMTTIIVVISVTSL